MIAASDRRSPLEVSSRRDAVAWVAHVAWDELSGECPVVADQLVLVVSSPACSVSCMRLASSAQRSCGAATNSVRMAALSTTFGPTLLMRVKNFSLRGCIRRPIGDPPGPTAPPYAAASRGGCPSIADDKWKGVGTLLSTSII